MAQIRWVWMRVKGYDLVFQRIKFKDKLGDWYWKEVTRLSPVPTKFKIEEAIKDLLKKFGEMVEVKKL